MMTVHDRQASACPQDQCFRYQNLQAFRLSCEQNVRRRVALSAKELFVRGVSVLSAIAVTS